MVRSSGTRLNQYKNGVWVAFLVIYLIHRYLLRPTQSAFIDSYLDDFLSVPIIAGITQTSMQLWLGPRYKLSWKQVLFIAGYLSVVFELLLPNFSRRYTSDLWDVLAYFFGAFCFILIHRKTIKPNA